MINKHNIIIVEGKTDTHKLKSIFPNVLTFETGGNQISIKTINTIKLLSTTNNIYIFTDPDFTGKKIRSKISNVLNNNCYQIYISRDKSKKKNGVAEASKEEIINSFKDAVKFINAASKTNFSYNITIFRK